VLIRLARFVVKDDEAVLARGVFLAVLKAIVNGQLYRSSPV